MGVNRGATAAGPGRSLFCGSKLAEMRRPSKKADLFKVPRRPLVTRTPPSTGNPSTYICFHGTGRERQVHGDLVRMMEEVAERIHLYLIIIRRDFFPRSMMQLVHSWLCSASTACSRMPTTPRQASSQHDLIPLKIIGAGSVESVNA